MKIKNQLKVFFGRREFYDNNFIFSGVEAGVGIDTNKYRLEYKKQDKEVAGFIFVDSIQNSEGFF